MKYFVWFVNILYILSSIYITRTRCNKLKPCDSITSKEVMNNHNSPKWFKWGRLYSYCIQRYQITQGKNITFDHGCSTTECKACISVCYQSTDKKKLDLCQQDCKSNACKIGCQFYDHLLNKTGNFTLDETQIPFIKSTVIREQRNPDNVDFQWTPVESHSVKKLSSIYLITIRSLIEKIEENANEYILGLIITPGYTASMTDMCNHVYEGYKYKYSNLKFAIKVYPINYNGPINLDDSNKKKLSFISKFTYPKKVMSVQNLTIAKDSPYFNQKGKKYNIVWNMRWNKKLMNDTSRGVTCRYNTLKCTNKDYEEEMLNKNILIQNKWFDEDSKGCNIPVQNTIDDHLRTCSITMEVGVKYGQCFLSDTTHKTLVYPGCKHVKNYKNKCPFPTKTPHIDTTVRKVNITYMGHSCNSSHVYTRACRDDNSTSCVYCSKPKYIISVNWDANDIPYNIHSYTIRWGRMEIIFNVEGHVLVSSNATLFEIKTLRKNDKPVELGVQVHAETDYSTKDWEWIRPSTSITLYVSEPERRIIERHITPSTTSTIITVVVIFIVLIGLGGIAFKFYKHRLMQQRDTSPLGDRVIVTREKAVITDEWEIDPSPSSINIIEKIGEGLFGMVYSATIDTSVIIKSRFAKQCGGVSLLSEHTKTAVKFLKDGAQDDEQTDFQNEISLMKSIGYHRNIVNMIGCSTIKQPLCLIVEYMYNGDLLHYLRKERSKQLNEQLIDNEDNKPLSPNDMMSFAWQIASGMEYLASHNVVHRDLAARNILVGKENHVKISDFGLSRQVTHEPIYISNNKTRRLPVKWMSVEAIYHKEFTTASDVWAYGVVLFEIVTLGGAPYPFIGHRELCKMLKSGYRMEKPDNCAVEMYDIMLHCWNEIPSQRPTFTELREHLEKIIEQGERYFSFEIDDSKAYYNVASFKSIPSDDEEENLFTKEYDEKPIQVKAVDLIIAPAKAAVETSRPVETVEKLTPVEKTDENETARYISPQSLKSYTDIEKSASFDNPNFHFNE